MTEYHKIVTVWERDPETKFRTLIEGAWATPEFEYLSECLWDATEKIDGTNVRVIWDGERVSFAGKTDNAQMPPHLLRRLEEMFPASVMSGLDGPCVLYGEGYGAKIQKGGGNYIPDGCSFILFDVKAGDWWLTRETVKEIALTLGIERVPIVAQSTLREAINNVRAGLNSLIADRDAEGLVLRPTVEMFDRGGRRIITKIKAKDFR